MILFKDGIAERIEATDIAQTLLHNEILFRGLKGDAIRFTHVYGTCRSTVREVKWKRMASQYRMYVDYIVTIN